MALLYSPNEVRQMIRQELKVQFDEMRKLILGRGTIGNWVKQPMACAMLNVKPRQMRNIRKDENKMDGIRWRKGRGKTVEYFKPDLEKYLSEITIS